MTQPPRPVDLLISGGHVVTADASWSVHPDGAVAIAGGRIVAVGPTTVVKAAVAPRETIDARGRLVVPGLIDAHLHPGFAILQPVSGKADWSKPGPFALGGDIKAFLAYYARADRAAVGEEESHAAARLALLAVLKSGTTCWNDGALGNADGIARASLELGLRGVVAYPGGQDLDFGPDGRDGRPTRAIDVDTLLARGEATVRRWNGAGEGRLRAWYTFVSDITASDELIRGTKALADRDGVGFSSHTCTVENEIEVSLAVHGRTGVERLAHLGALGRNWLGVHMGYASDAEVALMAAHGSSVAHCPGTSMGAGKGVLARRVVPKYVAAGIPVALGTDTTQTGSVLSQMTLAFHGHKEVSRDDRVFDPRAILSMATRDAARALLWDDEIGTLEVGRRADVTIFRADDARWAAFPDPLLGLIRVGGAGDVDGVVVDGRVLVRKGEVLGVDEELVIARAKEAAAAFVRRVF